MSRGERPNKNELPWEVDTNILLDVFENPALSEICFKKILGCDIVINETTEEEFIGRLKKRGHSNGKAREKADEIINRLEAKLIHDGRIPVYDKNREELDNYLDGSLPDPNDIRILSFCNQYQHGIITRDKEMVNFAEEKLGIKTINPVNNPQTKQYYETR